VDVFWDTVYNSLTIPKTVTIILPVDAVTLNFFKWEKWRTFIGFFVKLPLYRSGAPMSHPVCTISVKKSLVIGQDQCHTSVAGGRPSIERQSCRWLPPIRRRHLLCMCWYFRIDIVDTSERIFTKLLHMTCIGQQ